MDQPVGRSSESSVTSSGPEEAGECVVWGDKEEGGPHPHQLQPVVMLRFFSRRKAKGRAEQKVGTQVRKPPAPNKSNKHLLSCNIILLDGSDLGLDIGVSLFLPISYY